MKIRRVLMLHFDDAGYQARLQKIASDQSLPDISFRHCCEFDYGRPNTRTAEVDRLLPADDIAAGKLLEEVLAAEVGPELDEQIKDFNPEVVIIQGWCISDAGTLFSSDVLGAFLAMIADLMQKHPGVRFAVEGKTGWLVERSGRDYGSFDRRLAADQIRWVRHNFIEDAEVEELIRKLF